MSKQKADPASAPRAGGDIERQERTSRSFLRMRPRGFFSNRFELEIVEDYSDDNSDSQARKKSSWLNHFIDLNLLLMIIVVGVPILLYCIVATSK
ncbi:MAG: hypothetical protein EOO77_46150 [Oxalobacteraceae bacterium]|nr:MAG: hypothetical protein EOO77_46150 [Oxalobacteraceae bacterium]